LLLADRRSFIIPGQVDQQGAVFIQRLGDSYNYIQDELEKGCIKKYSPSSPKMKGWSEEIVWIKTFQERGK